MVYKFKKTRKREKHKLINKYVEKSCNNKCKINFLNKKKNKCKINNKGGTRKFLYFYAYFVFNVWVLTSSSSWKFNKMLKK